jgi:D-alanyl-D-alanine carboxypeptidase (penicillin-binding protein 5/6)
MREPATFFRTAAIALWGSALLFCHPVASARQAGPGSAPVAAAPYRTEAPIAMLKDLDSGRVLFARGAGQRFAPASMAKVMTAYVVVDLIARGELSWRRIGRWGARAAAGPPCSCAQARKCRSTIFSRA